jgi:phosphoribosylformimino-5-aminoimidazole carboxamide ribotide isomerase
MLNLLSFCLKLPKELCLNPENPSSTRGFTLKIIPVLDILNGVAVHAVRGRRKEYKPLKSVISDSGDPLEVAKVFGRLGFTELYIADLNAIMGNGNNLAIIERIANETGLQLMVDSGVADIPTGRTALQHGTSKVVVGTETLTTLNFVEQAVHLFGPDKVIVSLDMKDGQLLTKLKTAEPTNPVDVLRELQRAELTQVILLDLGRVGSGEGIDWALLCKVQENSKMAVFVGGGVHNMADLVKLNEMGVAGALVATSLHSGKITVEEIRRAGLNT